MKELANLPIVIRIFFGIAMVCIGIGLVYNSAMDVVPAVRSAQGAGQVGTFELERKRCTKNDCNWWGSYVGADGRVRLSDVRFAGDLPKDAKAGDKVAALDAGSTSQVYPSGGSSRSLISIPLMLLLGVACAGIGGGMLLARRR